MYPYGPSCGPQPPSNSIWPGQPGGCQPRPLPMPMPGGCCRPQPQPMEDIYMGRGKPPSWLPGHVGRGFGVDLDGDGRFQRGSDGILAYDFNRNGRFDGNEAMQTNVMLKVARGNFDLDGNGKVGFMEAIASRKMQKRFESQIRSGELGANLWVDRDGDGKLDQGEANRVNVTPQTLERFTHGDPLGGCCQGRNWYQL